MLDDSIQHEHSSYCATPGCNTPATLRRTVRAAGIDMPVIVCVFCASSIDARGAGNVCGAVNYAAADVIDLRCTLEPHPKGTPHFCLGFHWATQDEWNEVDASKYGK